MARWSLGVAAVAGIALTTIAFLILSIAPGAQTASTPAELLPALVSTAALCVVGLTIRRASSTLRAMPFAGCFNPSC